MKLIEVLLKGFLIFTRVLLQISVLIFICLPLGLLSLFFPRLRRCLESHQHASKHHLKSAQQQKQHLRDSQLSGERLARFNFLMEVLRAIDSQQTNEVICSIFLANLDKLDEILCDVLQAWARQTLPQVELETATHFAICLSTFSRFIYNFSSGNQVANLEIAITGYEIASTVFTRVEQPTRWAMNQCHLGTAYLHRLSDDRSLNIERAISIYESTLQVYTRKNSPLEWANIQNNLGTAYKNRILGERAENLETAIYYLQTSLEVHTCEPFAAEYLIIQYNLGKAYYDRIDGDQSTNLESTISCFRKALKIWTQNPKSTTLSPPCGYENFDHYAAFINKLVQVIFRERGRITSENIYPILEAHYECLDDIFILLLQSYFMNFTDDNEQVRKLALVGGEFSVVFSILSDLIRDFSQGNPYYNRKIADKVTEAIFPVFFKDISISSEELVEGLTLSASFWSSIENKEDLIEKKYWIRKGITCWEQAAALQRQIAHTETKETKTKLAYILRNLGSFYCHYSQLSSTPIFFLNKAKIVSEEALSIGIKYDIQNLGKYLTSLANCHRELARLGVEIIPNLKRCVALEEQTIALELEPDQKIDITITLGFSYCLIAAQNIDSEHYLNCAINLLEQICNHENFALTPVQKVTSLLNLGVAYECLGYDHQGIERDANLRKAVSTITQAVDCSDQVDDEQIVASTLYALGIAYCKLSTIFEVGSIDHSKNLHQAISKLKKSAELRQQLGFDGDLIHTLGAIGICHIHLLELDKAIETFRKALQVSPPALWGQESLPAAMKLGWAGKLAYTHNITIEGSQAIDIAIEGYSQAVEITEQIREWASSKANKQSVQGKYINFYFELVQAYINSGQLAKALEVVERSKTRNLIESLATRDLHPKGDIPANVLQRLDDLRQSLLTEEHYLNQLNYPTFTPDLLSKEPRRDLASVQAVRPLDTDQSRLLALRQELDELIAAHITPIDPSFFLTQKVNVLCFDEIQSILPDDRTVLIVWYLCDDKLYTFIVTRQSSEPLVITIGTEQLKLLTDVLNIYLDSYIQTKTTWQHQLPTLLVQLAEHLGIVQLLSQVQHMVPECDQLFLVPHRTLHLIPWHALPLEEMGQCLLDYFPRGVCYFPSVQLAKLTQQWTRPLLKYLFSVQDPTMDLKFTNLEVSAIRAYFNPYDDVLVQTEAYKEALNSKRLGQANCAHFSCHGMFNFENPEASALLLAGSIVDPSVSSSGEKSRFLTTGV